LKPLSVCVDGVCEKYCSIEGYNIRPGQSVKTKFCAELTCFDDFSGEGVTCGVGSIPGCKRLDPDYTLKYPKCCNKICVPEDDDLEAERYNENHI
jgi:Single domain von Willebrand factor type C